MKTTISVLNFYTFNKYFYNFTKFCICIYFSFKCYCELGLRSLRVDTILGMGSAEFVRLCKASTVAGQLRNTVLLCN